MILFITRKCFFDRHLLKLKIRLNKENIVTTFQELSTCAIANRRIHNGWVRHAIASLRDAISNKHNKNYEFLIKPRRNKLILAILERKEKDGLESNAKLRCGECIYCEASKRGIKI